MQDTLVQLAAAVVSGPKTIARVVALASYSAADVLLTMLDSQHVQDVRRMKEALVRGAEAEAEKESAEARQKLAEAVDAANRINIHKRNDAIARAAKEQALASAAKTRAEADAVRMDAETRRLEAIGKVQLNLLEAIERLRREDGDLFLGRDNLERILSACSSWPRGRLPDQVGPDPAPPVGN